MANQSATDRAKRLANGCCPIHGIPMGQVGLTELVNDSQLFIAECTRKDCNIQGTTAAPYGSLKLTSEHQHLLGPSKVFS